MPFERRAKARIQVPPDSVLVLSLGRGAEISGRVRELSPRGLVVESPRLARGDVESGYFEVAALEAPGERALLADVVLRRRLEEEGLAVMEVLDPESQGRLWDVCDRFRHADAARAAPGAAHPGGIPDRGHYSEHARRNRLGWLRDHAGALMPSLEHTGLDARKLTGNIENLVGSVEIPVGLAGPLLFRGQHARGHVVAPLATTEGTLVASTSRGATAITRAGGVMTKVTAQRMVRAPLYEFADVHAASRFIRWLEDHRPEIEAQIRLVSRHARLVSVDPIQLGNVVHARFLYETGDAAGQNMTTACTWRACQWINESLAAVPGLEPILFLVEGNASGDKKVSYLSFIGGRGSRVSAECFIDRDTLRDVLKTTPEAMDHAHRMGTVSGIQAGMLGYTINATNVIAAMFVALGQDIACVHESGGAIFSVEAAEDGLHASMVLPSLIVGSVGGGTGLPNQHDLLESIGCAGDDRSERLAEIVCGFALALDLSTQAAVVGGQFADSHERLGRNRPVQWLRLEDLVPEFFKPMLARALSAPDLEVSEVVPVDFEMGASIIGELTSRGVGSKLTGLFPLRLTHTSAGGSGVVDVVAKVKPLDEEVILESSKLASLCGGDLARTYHKWRDWTGFKDTHTRELAIYRSEEPELTRVLPKVYGVHEDAAREAYVVVMERLGSDVILRDSGEEPTTWAREHVDAALRGIAGVHALWLGRERELLEDGRLGRVLGADRMSEMRELWRALADHNATEYPDLADAATLAWLRREIDAIPDWWTELEAMPRTLVHNDFNPRNIALRREGLELVAYDWELATLQVPQRDLAELLAYALPVDAEETAVEHHLDVHRDALEAAAGVALDRETWRRGYRLALRDFAITRLQLYLMAHEYREYAFIEDLVATTRRLLAIEGERAEAARARGG